MVNRGDGWLDRAREALGRLWSGPPGRVRAAARRRHVQAMPASEYRPPATPVEQWNERRQLSHYARPVRPRDQSPTTLVIVIVVITLGVGLLYGVSWALSNAGSGNRNNGNGQAAAVASPTAVAKPAASPVASPGPAPAGSPTTILIPGGTGSPTADQPPGARRTHRVQAGDTLARIAQQYGTTVDAIMRANNITDRGRILRIGEELIIPAP